MKSVFSRSGCSVRAAAGAVFLALAALLVAPGTTLRAEEAVEPSDIYLQAYLSMQEAEKMEKRRDINAAYFKFQDASDLFDSVARSFPDWNRQMVDYRRRKIREKLAAMRAEHGVGGLGNDPAAPATGTPGSGASAQPSVVARPGAGTAAFPVPGSSASVQIQQRFAQYESRIQRLISERADLQRRLESRESLLIETRRQLLATQKQQESLRQKLVATEARKAAEGESERIKELESQVADLTSELAKAVETMGEANEKTTALLAELESANATIRELRENEQRLIEERDQLAAIIGGSEGEAGSARQLVVDNLRLKRELEEARKAIASLEAGKEADQAQIAELRGQLADVKVELARIQDENQRYRSRIAELSDRLKMNLDRIAGAPDVSVPEAVQENQMLRAIILRQLKAQQRRQQAKQIVLAQLAGLEADSADLIASLEAVAGPPIVLDEREQGLFKDPQFDQFVGDATVQGTLMAPANPNAVVRPSDTADTSGPGSLAGPLLQHASAAAQAFGRGDFEEAEGHYVSILEAEPLNVFSLQQLGIVKLRLRKFDEAETLLRKALAYSDWQNPDCHFLMGVVHFKRGRQADAVDFFEQGLDIDPENSRARHYLGLIALRQGDSKRAELEFKEALAIDPTFADAHFNLAVLYATSDEPAMELAREHYQEALQFGAKPDAAMEKFLGS